MPYSFPDGPVVTVASGATDSPAMIADHTISDADQITVLSPATLPETANIQISLDFNVNYAREGITLAAATAAATWETEDNLGAAGAHVLIPIANIAPFRAWRIHLNGAAGGDRAFRVVRRTLVEFGGDRM